MNLLSSNLPFPRAVGATGSFTHSTIGVPFTPKPLNRSSVLASMSVVGASVAVWLSTVWGELKGTKSATANKIRVRIGKTFLIFDFDLLGANKRVARQNWHNLPVGRRQGSALVNEPA